MNSKISFLFSIVISLVTPLIQAQETKPLQRAEITSIVNEVRVVKPQSAPQPAKLNEAILPNQGVLTGPKSRAELLFSDRTLARLGANTQFTFLPGSRTTEIQQGTMLLQVPKGAGGAQVKTAAVTAAITGTTIMIEFFPGLSVKIIVLEGTLRLSLSNRLGESLLLTAGKMLIMRPDAKQLPDPVDVDLKKLIKTSKLISGMDNSDELSNELIDEEVAKQQQLKKKGTLLDTNIVILGGGTETILTDLDLLAEIENAINSGRVFSGTEEAINPTNPFNTITNPDPFPLGPDATVSTNPSITNSLGIFQGVNYTSNGTTDMDFLFGSSSPTDAALDAEDQTPGTTLAAFRFNNLSVLGDPTVTTVGGPTTLALIAVNNLTFGPATYTFSGLTDLFFGAGNSITIPSGVILNNPVLGLIFYARNPGSDLTFLGSAITEMLGLAAAQDLFFGPGAYFSGSEFTGEALGSISVSSSTIAASLNTELKASNSITIDGVSSLNTALAILEAGNQITVPGSALATTGLADLSANTINLSGTFANPLRLTAFGGGVTGGATLLDLRSLTTMGGGSVNAGFIQSSAPLGTLWNVSGELISATSVLAPNVDIQADGINFGTGSFSGRNVTIFGLSSTLGLQGAGGITANDIVAITKPVLAEGTINANNINAGSVTTTLAGINVTGNLTAGAVNAGYDVTVGGNLSVGGAITVTGNSVVSANGMNLNAIQTSNLTDVVLYQAPTQITLSSFSGPGAITLNAPTLNLNNSFTSSQLNGVLGLSVTTLNITGDFELDTLTTDFSPYTVSVGDDVFFDAPSSTFIASTVVAGGDIVLDALGRNPLGNTTLTASSGAFSLASADLSGIPALVDGANLTVTAQSATLGGSGPISLSGLDVGGGTAGNGGNFALTANSIDTVESMFGGLFIEASGGDNTNGNGGTGGNINFSSPGNIELNTTTSLLARGGTGGGTSGDGGDGGSVTIGAAGTFSTDGLFFSIDTTGGSGTGSSGNGGNITVSAQNGVDIGSNVEFYASSFSGGNGFGGDGGFISVNSASGPVTLDDFVELHSFGGSVLPGGLGGGDGGHISLLASTDITLGNQVKLRSQGGNSPGGTTLSGNASYIAVNAGGGSFSVGDSSLFESVGGSGANGGSSGFITINALNDISFGAFTDLNASGGSSSDNAATAPSGGSIDITSTAGNIIFADSNIIQATGGNNPNGFGGNGGSVTMTANNGVIEFAQYQLVSAKNGTGSTATQDGAGGSINLTAQEIRIGTTSGVDIRTHSPGEASSGGVINLNALRATGQAINISNSSQLLALAAAAGANGGQISVTSAGGDVNISDSTIAASGGNTIKSLVDVKNIGPNGVINLTNANLSADILKVGALGPNGSVIINGGTFTANDTLKIYGGSATNGVTFAANTNLDGSGLKHIAGQTVRINDEVIVSVSGPPANVYTNNPEYTGFGGNGSTTGTFIGSGATTQPLASAPPY
ncbi:MAG: hypothetical protein OHK005_11690 [Candidatus Methylacidiphilales bacterium]